MARQRAFPADDHLPPRGDGESNQWYSRFVLYLHMPPTERSLLGSVHLYEAQIGKEQRSASIPGAWYKASERFQWKARAEAYDEETRKADEACIEAEKQAILKRGYARMHRRVQKLDALAEKLEQLLAEDDKLWLPDVKSVGTGPLAQRVDLIQFNDALIREYRATLADIAAELGERVKATKTELTGGIDINGARDALLDKLKDAARKISTHDESAGESPA